ncbi:calmodulin-lysine N-methyltransferase-like [Protopterus annectens]|uniref:calmodulin-lysine N-methyltransferase-like n=1 Tax=Protopterus annectens TaxID=7888 RepID=UPI001CF9383A|nr:calmodulin-lysine N-methyltransferase-like [Protopterus annectens]
MEDKQESTDSEISTPVENDKCQSNTVEKAEEYNGVAHARWKLLRQALKQKRLDNDRFQQISVRRFSSFGLFSTTQLKQDEQKLDSEQWFQYRCISYPQYCALIRHKVGPLDIEDVLNSFDNTGNVCDPHCGEGVLYPPHIIVSHALLRLCEVTEKERLIKKQG